MHTKRRAGRLVAGLSSLVVSGSFLAVPASAAPAAVAPGVEEIAVSAVPPPPPAPRGRDGRQLKGAWWGPYTLRNVHSGKCLDMTGYEDGDRADQYRCLDGNPSQAWYEWQYMGDGSISFFLLGNSATGKCITGLYGKGQIVYQQSCYEVSPETWYRTSDNLNQYVNDDSGMCLEVGGWATNDGADVITWDCLGNPNQLWLEYDWH